MIDFRCHLAGIVGVFLALGVGMLIGTQLSQDGMLLEEQMRLVERIEDGLNRMRAENRRLQEEVDALTERLRREERFVDAAIASWAGGRLPAGPVTLYAAEDDPLASRLRAVLELAGVRVAVKWAADPPPPAQLAAPYVVLWAQGWGPVEELWGAPPPGGVVAAAAAPGESAGGARPGVVPLLPAPEGLQAVVEGLAEAGTGMHAGGAAPEGAQGF